MPSPFPGMDPYLERLDLWLELHRPLIVYMADEVQPRLPEDYIARLEAREFVTDSLYRELGIVIRWLRENSPVTAVDLLSPQTKRRGPAREQYLDVQRDRRRAGVNLVEIDLLRDGLSAASLEGLSVGHTSRPDHLVVEWRRGAPEELRVHGWGIRASLPSVWIPLGAGVPDLRIPLQPLFNRAYEGAAFQKLIDYVREPEPPLRPEDAAWADELLRAAGKRGEPGA